MQANVSNAKGNASNGTGTEEVQVIFKVEGILYVFFKKKEP